MKQSIDRNVTSAIKLALTTGLKRLMIRKAAKILKKSDFYDEYFAYLVGSDIGQFVLVRKVEPAVTVHEISVDGSIYDC